MELRNLRIFASAAELGSLSRAATSLGIAQSALSRQISALEAEFGGRLFHRTGRGMQLTELGQSLLPRALAMLSDAEAMTQEAQAVMSTPRGVVSVGLVPSVSHPLASQLYCAVQERFPGIRLRLYEGYSGEIEEWLASGRIDIGIFNRYRSETSQNDTVLNTNVQLVMPAANPLLLQASVAFKDLANLPLALPMRPNGLRSILDELCQRTRITLNVQMETNSSTTIKDAVMHGGLYSLLAPNAIVQERRLGLLGGVLINDPAIQLSTQLDSTTNRPLTAAAREILRMLPPMLDSLTV